MKRILIVFVIVTLLLYCSLMNGCDKKETEETQQRFAIEYQQKFGALGILSIIRDTETGKAYMFVHDGYAGGLTILEEGE